ncbi:hypothetical protein C0J52_11359 [Blattella germanica]|nr:hypothetical protein C0J52_11359 [Blattella germanica]
MCSTNRVRCTNVDFSTWPWNVVHSSSSKQFSGDIGQSQVLLDFRFVLFENRHDIFCFSMRSVTFLIFGSTANLWD